MTATLRHAVALVAEDEPLLRMDAAVTLEDEGFTVLEASSAEDALRHLSDVETVELLFTDIDMPGAMDGIDLAHEVVRRWPSVSVVICSGRMTPSAADMPAGARFIAKPFSTELMLAAIDKMRNKPDAALGLP